MTLKHALKAAEDLEDRKINEEIYNYWIENRRNNGHSLMREFWKGVDKRDPNLKIFLDRKHKKMELRPKKEKKIQVILKTQKLLNQFKEIKNIMIWIRNRETVKKYINSLNVLDFEMKRAQEIGSAFENPDKEILMSSNLTEKCGNYRNLFKSVI